MTRQMELSTVLQQHGDIPLKYVEVKDTKDHYTTMKQIGDGGTGVVYIADRKDSVKVAVKKSAPRSSYEDTQNKIIIEWKHLQLLYNLCDVSAACIERIYLYIPNAQLVKCNEEFMLELTLYERDLSKELWQDMTWPSVAPVSKSQFELVCKIARQLLDAVALFEKLGLYLSDLKVDNFLLDNNDNLHLIDFEDMQLINQCNTNGCPFDDHYTKVGRILRDLLGAGVNYTLVNDWMRSPLELLNRANAVYMTTAFKDEWVNIYLLIVYLENTEITHDQKCKNLVIDCNPPDESLGIHIVP